MESNNPETDVVLLCYISAPILTADLANQQGQKNYRLPHRTLLYVSYELALHIYRNELILSCADYVASRPGGGLPLML